MTEGNTQLVLHDESLDDIVAILRNESAIPGQEERNVIANTIEAQR